MPLHTHLTPLECQMLWPCEACLVLIPAWFLGKRDWGEGCVTAETILHAVVLCYDTPILPFGLSHHITVLHHTRNQAIFSQGSSRESG